MRDFCQFYNQTQSLTLFLVLGNTQLWSGLSPGFAHRSESLLMGFGKGHMGSQELNPDLLQGNHPTCNNTRHRIGTQSNSIKEISPIVFLCSVTNAEVDVLVQCNMTQAPRKCSMAIKWKKMPRVWTGQRVNLLKDMKVGSYIKKKSSLSGRQVGEGGDMQRCWRREWEWWDPCTEGLA